MNMMWVLEWIPSRRNLSHTVPRPRLFVLTSNSVLKMFKLALLPFLLLGATLLEQPGGAFAQDDCVSSFDPATDYFPEKFLPTRYAVPDFFENDPTQAQLDRTTDLIEITYHNNYKIVTNKFVNVTYLLYQCGTTPRLVLVTLLFLQELVLLSAYRYWQASVCCGLLELL